MDIKPDKENNNRKILEGLFNEYYPALCSFAQHYVTDNDLVEDIVQDVFAALCKNKEVLNQIQSAKSFLYTSVKNKCLNQLKHISIVGKYTELEKSEKQSESYFIDHVIEEETHRLIHNAIQELPPRCREIVLLSLNGFENKKIAKELNISLNTVKTQKAIAYKQLRIQLKHLLALTPLLFEQLFN